CSVNRTGALVLNPLARRAALTHRTGDLCLDKPFDLIEGHPAFFGAGNSSFSEPKKNYFLLFLVAEGG
ncbi:MAG: hypothetical protein ACYCSN_18980, partial [Acidobacteriaceae bacterium]